MKQTFIICVENESDCVLEFERWPYKRAQTCIDKMIELYRTYPSLYVPHLTGAAKVICYPTPDGYHKAAPVWSVSVDEFRELLKEDAA